MTKDVIPFGQGLNDFVDSLDAKIRLENPNLQSGITTLDQMLAGLQPGNLYVVAGVPGIGKSSFVESALIHLWLGQKKSGIYFHLEGPEEMLATKLIANLGRIDILRLKSGHLEDTDWKRVTSVISILQSGRTRLSLVTSAKIYANEIEEIIKGFVESNKVDFLILDYVQRIFFKNSEIRAIELGDLARTLKSIAISLNIPVIAVSQLNRRLEQRPDKRPILGDLRESGVLEEEADTIIFVYRDDYYDKDSPDRYTAELIVAKHRTGPIGMVRAAFVSPYRSFENYVPMEDP